MNESSSEFDAQSWHVFANAAMGDYFCLWRLTFKQNETEWMVPQGLADLYGDFFDRIGVEYKLYALEEKPGFVFFEMASPEAAEQVEDYYQNFNNAVRPSCGIPMPDVYLGGKDVDARVVTWYLKSIVGFLESGGTTSLNIPVGMQGSHLLVARYTTAGPLGMGLAPFL